MSGSQGRVGLPSRYTQVALTVVALLLAMLVLKDGGSSANSAQASPESHPNVGLPNAADQRRKMIIALENMDRRLAKIESKLAGGAIEVKVVSMPQTKSSE